MDWLNNPLLGQELAELEPHTGCFINLCGERVENPGPGLCLIQVCLARGCLIQH